MKNMPNFEGLVDVFGESESIRILEILEEEARFKRKLESLSTSLDERLSVVLGELSSERISTLVEKSSKRISGSR